jgi:hypothetical protein
MNPLNCVQTLFVADLPPELVADCANRAQIFQAVWLPLGVLATIAVGVLGWLWKSGRLVGFQDWLFGLRMFLPRPPERNIISTVLRRERKVIRITPAVTEKPAEQIFAADGTTIVMQPPPNLPVRRPLSLRERVQRAIDFCEAEMGTYDDMDPRRRPIGYFRTAARTVNEIANELKGARVGMDYTLDRGVGRGSDPTRADIDAAVRSLRGLDWKHP